MIGKTEQGSKGGTVEQNRRNDGTLKHKLDGRRGVPKPTHKSTPPRTPRMKRAHREKVWEKPDERRNREHREEE